jgi:hypothetical protein
MIGVAGPMMACRRELMKVAFIIYDGMTALDFVGVYDAVTRLQQLTVSEFCKNPRLTPSKSALLFVTDNERDFHKRATDSLFILPPVSMAPGERFMGGNGRGRG